MQLFPLSLSSTLTNPQPVVVLVMSSGGPQGPGSQVGPPRGVFPAAAAAAVQMCSVCLRTSVQTLPERPTLFSSAGVILAQHPFLFSTHNPLILLRKRGGHVVSHRSGVQCRGRPVDLSRLFWTLLSGPVGRVLVQLSSTFTWRVRGQRHVHRPEGSRFRSR